MAENNIKVTGLGPVSALGTGLNSFRKNLFDGKSCGRRLDRVETETGPCPLDLDEVKAKVGAPIAGKAEEDYLAKRDEFLTKKQRKRLGWGAERTYVAARLALSNSGITINQEDEGVSLEGIDPHRVGVFIGTNIPGGRTLRNMNETLNEEGPRRVSPYTIPRTMPNQPASIISLLLGAKGPSFAVNTACASSNTALAQAYMHLKQGTVDLALAGGVDTLMTLFHIVGFDRLRATSSHNENPRKASRPFDAERDGFVYGEGAGMVVLDTRERSKANKSYMTLKGVGSTNDSHHMTAPLASGEGAAKAMSKALKKSDWGPEEVDYISAHGTSTPMNDPMETQAIKAALGDHARTLKISSLKSQIGHSIAASGALEAIATALAFEEQKAPPTINYETPDEECDLDYVPNSPEKMEINRALSNNFAFGGHNSVLAFEAPNAQ